MELGLCYGWTASFVGTYNSLIRNGGSTEDGTLATVVQSSTRNINSAIKTFFGE